MNETTVAVAPALKMGDYREALRVAAIPYDEIDFERDAVDDVVRRAAGVLLLGGKDIDPALYHEERHPTTKIVAAPRDHYEIALVRAAIARDLPIFAICRGIQLLNVALGGSLVQDVPTQVARPLNHDPEIPHDRVAHPVAVTPGSRLAALLRDELEADGSCGVNSRHHQSVKAVADGLVVTARAADGVIEGVERPASRFCVAVQWHPESFWETGRFQGLFKGFYEAARLTPRT
jgi:putative glutamine amidotransferase